MKKKMMLSNFDKLESKLTVNLTEKKIGIRTGLDLTIDDLAGFSRPKNAPVYAQRLVKTNRTAVSPQHPDQSGQQL